ncbi:MAG: hypothetical protein ACREB8_05395, partial [Pseudolabrys sp.]
MLSTSRPSTGPSTQSLRLADAGKRIATAIAALTQAIASGSKVNRLRGRLAEMGNAERGLAAVEDQRHDQV